MRKSVLFVLSQYRTKIVRQLRQKILRQIVQIRRSNTDAFQGEFVQDGGKYASKCRNTMLQGVRQRRGNNTMLLSESQKRGKDAAQQSFRERIAVQQSGRYCKAVGRSLCGAVLMFLIMLMPGTAAFGEKTEHRALVVLGDSIASGYGLAEYKSGNNYSAPLSFGNMLDAEFESYRNFAVDGRTTQQLLDALSTPSEALKEAVSEADVIVISIGGNDFLKPMISALKSAAMGDYELIAAIFKGEFKTEMLGEYSQRILNAALDAAKRVDVDRTADNIERCVKLISKLNPNAEIILMTVYDPFSGNVLLKAASDAAKERLSILNTEITALEGGNVKVIDVYKAFDGKATEYTNINRLDIHPNAEGHYKIYELIEEVINAQQSTKPQPVSTRKKLLKSPCYF